VDTQLIPLAPLVAAYAPSQAGSITGQTELHAILRGPLKRKDLVEAHVTVPQLSVNYKNAIQLAAVAPIKIDYANGIAQLQRSAIRGTGTNLEFEGAVPVAANAPARLMLVGNVDLRLAQLLDPDVTSSGQLQFDINSKGVRADQNVQGQIKIVNATFATGDLPIGLENGNGVMKLTGDRLNITEFTGEVGGGTMRATGAVMYRPSLRFDLAVTGRDMRILVPGGIRTGVNTNLSLSGTTSSSLLRGDVNVVQLQFTPDFDLMNFMGSLGGGETTPPPTEGFSNGLRLDVAVRSTSGVNLVSRTLSVQGAANLRVTGTAAQPVVLGRVNLTGGDLILMGNRYILQGGTVDFINPSRTEPVMNVSVNTTIQQYNIQMRLWGPADHLHTNYSSDPALPPSDIINLVAFGKTSEAQAANPNPPGNLGAQSLIASQVSSQVTNRLEKIAGISQLSIDPVLGGNGQTPGAKIAIQQRVTSKIYVTFATDVSSTQNQTIRLEYHATPTKSVSVTRDQNGGFGIDTKFKKSW
jgi:translocation and assembly module TamB